PLHRGGRFSTNARGPSRASLLSSTFRLRRASMRYASSMVPTARPRSALSFVAAMASGAFAVILAAQSRARSMSWCRGTISLSNPSSSARVAGIGSAVSRNSIAAGHAIWRGRRAVVPRLQHPEHRLRARNADVGAVEQLHAARDTRPVHRGDDRLVDVEVAQHRLGAGAEALAVVGPGGGEQRDVVAQVAPGAERVV